MADIAHDLKNRTIPIIDSVQTTLDYVNDPKGDIQQTLANVRQLTAELRETRVSVDRLLRRVDGLADKEVRDAVSQANQLLTRADAMASDFFCVSMTSEAIPHPNRSAATAETIHKWILSFIWCSVVSNVVVRGAA